MFSLVHALNDRHGLSVAIQDSIGRGLVHLAVLHLSKQGCSESKYSMLLYVLEKGVSVSTRDNFGNMPLHYAFRAGDATAARILLEYYRNTLFRWFREEDVKFKGRRAGGDYDGKVSVMARNIFKEIIDRGKPQHRNRSALNLTEFCHLLELFVSECDGFSTTKTTRRLYRGNAEDIVQPAAGALKDIDLNAYFDLSFVQRPVSLIVPDALRVKSSLAKQPGPQKQKQLSPLYAVSEISDLLPLIFFETYANAQNHQGNTPLQEYLAFEIESFAPARIAESQTRISSLLELLNEFEFCWTVKNGYGKTCMDFFKLLFHKIQQTGDASCQSAGKGLLLRFEAMMNRRQAGYVLCRLGCGDWLSPSEVLEHETYKCPFKVTSCPNQCGLCLRRAMWSRCEESHLVDLCPSRLMHCPLGCELKVAWSELETHTKQTCGSRQLPTVHCSLGCGERYSVVGASQDQVTAKHEHHVKEECKRR